MCPWCELHSWNLPYRRLLPEVSRYLALSLLGEQSEETIGQVLCADKKLFGERKRLPLCRRDTVRESALPDTWQGTYLVSLYREWLSCIFDKPDVREAIMFGVSMKRRRLGTFIDTAIVSAFRSTPGSCP